MEILLKIKRIPQPGDQSSDVEVLQAALNAKGAGLSVDGDYGPITRKAVAVFQKRNGLTGTGVAGEKTLALLGITADSTVDAPPILHPSLPGTITRAIIADAILNVIENDIKNKLRETNGKNRSNRIDTLNKRAGTYLGAPYCASGGWCAIDDACKELHLKNPLKPTASSQAFRKTSYIPAEYIRANGELGKRGDTATLQVVGDSSHGHHVTVEKDQQAGSFLFDTAEYNTNGLGSRDGDGAYFQKRSTVDRSRENAGKIFVCFTDVSQYVLDHNFGKMV